MNWRPEIFYEESENGLAGSFPFIPVPPDEKMPALLYIFESRDTGEIEPGPDGEDLPVTEMTLHQYADMSILKDGLTQEEFDKIRSLLGLDPLRSASKQGEKITQTVRKNLE
jgi:hypothetical protein